MKRINVLANQTIADEDGYGMEDNDELAVYAVIDRNMRVQTPFRPFFS